MIIGSKVGTLLVCTIHSIFIFMSTNERTCCYIFYSPTTPPALGTS